MSIINIFLKISVSYLFIILAFSWVVYPELRDSIKNMFLAFFCQARKQIDTKVDSQEIKTQYDIKECPICMGEFKSNKIDLVAAKCGHLYCANCIVEYLKSQQHMMRMGQKSINCPCCRTVVQSLLFYKITDSQNRKHLNNYNLKFSEERNIFE